VGDTPLDDIAEARLSLAPDDIARLGFAVADIIAGSSPVDIEPEIQKQAEVVAKALLGAQRPLIVSGTGCGSSAVLRASAQIASALCQAHNRAMLCLAVPEANSLGQAMLCGAGAPGLSELSERVDAGSVDTLVILENDLYRRAPKKYVDALLSKVANVIVMDSMDNPTLSACSLALPAASFAESEGTLVSMEGRAQRYYPVFVPQQERRSSWVWLLACMKEGERAEVHELHGCPRGSLPHSAPLEGAVRPGNRRGNGVWRSVCSDRCW